MGKQAKRTIKFNKASKQKHSFMNISRKVPLQKLAEEILLLFVVTNDTYFNRSNQRINHFNVAPK